ncbi:T9SS type A sorting domain-containing protein [Flavobacterium sp. Sd200]|uniref:T9SS type A sorting domain-containing protein n=1 Tax=Flavobacterium sp. Sd200 TaxID=2692211 RepID=UPI00136D9485|nr:T9SS type A sorting domain-containing protein [Flavobacterium sp. Sd200]MXN90134.1 T9SS type A sorting domain-containing protein [Flavobacterium sp. Sd200]
MKTITYLFLAFIAPFFATAQLQNTDFEEWINPVTDVIFANRPVGWTISNGRAIMEDTNTYFPPVTDVQNGNYALKMSIWYNYTKDMAEQTAPIDFRPTALVGYYKYTGNRVYSGVGEIDDKASASIYLTKWNEALSHQDTIGSGDVLLDASEDYIRFVCPVAYTSNEIPDTVKVLLDCSLMNRPGYASILAPDGVASFFTVDNIALTEEVLKGDELQQKKFNVYPNPVVNALSLDGFQGTVTIFNALGKLVLKNNNVHTGKIEVTALPSGIYYLQLNNNNALQNIKFIKQ